MQFVEGLEAGSMVVAREDCKAGFVAWLEVVARLEVVAGS